VALQDPIVVCGDCGAIHHRSCWEAHRRCGSYRCRPALRALDNDPAQRLVITAEDLRGVILLPPAPGVRAGAGAPVRSLPVERPRINRLAIAALITAVVGIPLFGVVTGFVAIVLAILALSRIQVSNQRGFLLALGGLFLGIIDVVGWLALLSYALSWEPSVRLPEGSEPGLTAADVAPKLYRAMQANVLIERRSGWFGLATGSGVILSIADGSGLIVTNRHIVDSGFTGQSAPPDLNSLNTGALTVKLLNGPSRPGQVVWVAPDGIDLALVRITVAPGEAAAAQWAPGRPLRIGDAVFAIGNPQRLSWTHTQGVISQFRTMNLGGRTIRIIQTQTAINAGNSGGGLYDNESYLIGINTWTSDKRSTEGLSFAIMFDSLLALDPPGIAVRGSGDAEKRSQNP
jgi:S1-C subfamily serine protease